MKVINPATGEAINDYPEHSADEVQARLQAAGAAFVDWRKSAMSDRAKHLHGVASGLRARQAELALLMTREMGKPIGQSEAEVEKCALACDFLADNAAEFLAPEKIETEASKSYVRFDPLGPVLAIMPWNFPFWQVIRAAAPAIMAGNVVVLKHAPNVPGCAVTIEHIFAAAGFPAGVFTNLLIASNQAAEGLIAHPLIRGVTLTGSERAGMAVAQSAGKVLKKTVLELGGSDPFIVLKDVDLAAVAAQAAAARCINNGQSCIAAKRFIVEEPIAEKFEMALAATMAQMSVGDPADPATKVGPLARQDLRDHLHQQVESSIRQGAKLLTGGNVIPGPGFFYQPTVLTNVRPGMPAFDEETFGPVAAVTRAKDPEDAVALANFSRYGLGASLWTNDAALAERLAGEIEAGCVFVNAAVKSDPRLPFGGIKQSGWGRELARDGVREFTNIKSVWLASAPPAPPISE